MVALINNEAITEKEFGKGDEDGKTSKTLTNQERDNYNKERRFIFACESKKEMDSWVLNFNRQIAKNNFDRALAKMMREKGSPAYEGRVNQVQRQSMKNFVVAGEQTKLVEGHDSLSRSTSPAP